MLLRFRTQNLAQVLNLLRISMILFRCCSVFHFTLRVFAENPLWETLICHTFVNKLHRKKRFVKCDRKLSSDWSFVIYTRYSNISCSWTYFNFQHDSQFGVKTLILLLFGYPLGLKLYRWFFYVGQSQGARKGFGPKVCQWQFYIFLTMDIY